VSYTNGVATLKREGIVFRFKDSDLSEKDRQYLTSRTGVAFSDSASEVVAEQERKTALRASEELRFKTIDVPSLYGLTVDELRARYRDLIIPATQPGTTAQAHGWRYWREVWFGFNANGKLSHITFEPGSTMSEAEAKSTVTNFFRVDLPQCREQRSLACLSYHNLPGKVQTVNFNYKDWKSADKKVSEIGLFFSIGWDE